MEDRQGSGIVFPMRLLTNSLKITFKSYEQGREKAQGAGKVLI